MSSAGQSTLELGMSTSLDGSHASSTSKDQGILSTFEQLPQELIDNVSHWLTEAPSAQKIVENGVTLDSINNVVMSGMRDVFSLRRVSKASGSGDSCTDLTDNT
jgi:hypothetical protein